VAGLFRTFKPQASDPSGFARGIELVIFDPDHFDYEDEREDERDFYTWNQL